MQRQSIKQSQRLFEQSLDIQQDTAKTVLRNSITAQRSTQRQGAELAQQLFNAQVDAVQSAFDEDEVRSTADRQFVEFTEAQRDAWNEFEQEVLATVDNLSTQQREMFAQWVEAFLDAQRDTEQQTIDGLRQTQGVAETAQEKAKDVADETTDAAEQQVEVTTETVEEQLEDLKGIGPTYADRLQEQGIESVTDLAEAITETVADAAEVSESQAEQWIETVQSQT